MVTAVVVLLGGIGGGAFWLGTAMRGSDTHTSPDQALGIDDPREVEATASDGTEGGTLRKQIQTRLGAAGYDCAGVTNTYGTVVFCSHSTNETVPTYRWVRMDIVDDTLTKLRANVELDPGWRDVETSGDSSFDDPGFSVVDSSVRAFTTIAAATFPASDLSGVNTIISRAPGGGQESVTTSVGKVVVQIATNSSSMTVTRKSGDTVATPNGLHFVTLTQLEKRIQQQGMQCDRGQETLTCRSGKVTLTAEFPVPIGTRGDHNIDRLSVTAPATNGAPDDTLVDVATAVSDLVVGKIAGSADAAPWIEECFGPSTVEVLRGANNLRCSPTVEGTVDDPRITAYTFSLGRAAQGES